MKACTALCVVSLLALAACERRGPDEQPEDTGGVAPRTEPGAAGEPQGDPPATPPEPAVPPESPRAAGGAATAEARIEPTQGNAATGMVRFSRANGMLTIVGTINDLEPGQHGLHVHEKGDCSAPDASSAGGHFNPDGDPHGSPRDGPDSHHVGDLGNITVDADGEAEVSIDDPEMQLTGPESVIGKALIVHAGEDDLQSQPSGDSGPRVGCGVIRATNGEENPTAG